MRSRRLIFALVALLMALSSAVAFADKHGHGRGHGDDDDDDRGRGEWKYSRHDRDVMRGWRHEHERDLPPGLAKRDRLPPGLERQLRVRGTLPPGLRGYVQPCPYELERELPPPPPECAHVVIGGHIVLMNRQTYMVLDIFHFER